MVDKKPKPEIRLHVTFEESQYFGDTRYAKIIARAYVLAPDRYHDGKLGLFTPGSYEIDGARAGELECLEITSQVSDNYPDPYAWKVQYNGTAFELERAEAAVKVLRRINATMTKLDAEWGRPGDLATYMVRAAKALTNEPKPFMASVKPEHDYEGTGYKTMGPDELRYWIQDQLKEWRKKYNIRVKDE